MYSIKFKIHIDELDMFLKSNDFDNYSVFEDVSSGFSDKLDENGFPIANYYICEIFSENADVSVPGASVSVIDNKDWVEIYSKELHSIIINNFYIYNDKYQEFPNDSSLIPIKINAAFAFGSGDHQTTRSCISMMSHINIAPKSILDMGCGSGILSICAAKIWSNAKVVAIDIDQEAVNATIENFSKNNVLGCILCDHCISDTKKFDLIMSNILKQPLINLSNNFYNALCDDGKIIISGFIESQYNDVNKAYEDVGFKNEKIKHDCEWVTVLYSK